MPKPIPALVTEKIGRITTMAVEITGDGRYHVFTGWSGHVRSIHAYAHHSTADYSGMTRRDRVFSLYADLEADNAEQQLNDIIETMESMR
jgi:hypothetical protein